MLGQGQKKFRVGKWKIQSQSLGGQKLETSQWILPKNVPQQHQDQRLPKLQLLNFEEGQELETSQWFLPENVPQQHQVQRQPKSQILNAFQLENPGVFKSSLSGRQNKPTFTDMWLPHKNSDHQSFLQDGNIFSELEELQEAIN